ncbi:MAG: hypothetical protein RJA61_239 [Candidatus Parcubacteria bacterium]|jgi:DNA processing protein
MEYKILEVPRKEFPELLSHIPDPPKRLWHVGNLPTTTHKILCVVGSRSYTPYGKEVCETLIQGLRGYPITIVSGLALGIDSIAHTEALKAGLQTIAVPGSGLDSKVLYPKSNMGLARKILESGGGLISEFEPTFAATPWSFPQRNRIMAGMSHATLVIEADIKSGTLITSRLASDYNRDVFTVPGSIFGKQSLGPHMLIRLGATLIRNSEDIIESFGFEISHEVTRKKVYEDCSEEEKKILTLIETTHERDEIIRQSGISPSEVNSLLTVLELKGLTREFMGEIHIV